MSTEQSIVAEWNEVMLEAVRAGSASPTPTTYALHMVSAAIYDAWAAYDPDAYGHYGRMSRPTAEHTEANKAEAVSFAAHGMLIEMFPGEQARFDAMLASLGYDPADATTAADVGRAAVSEVLAARENDGSNRENDYADTSGYAPVNDADPNAANAPGGDDFDANRWQPLRVPNGTLTDANGVPVADDGDPSTFDDQVALTPHWGGVEAFALDSGDQFRPPAPPQLGDFEPYVDGEGTVTTGDAAYRDQVTEVLNASADLTTEQKVIAEYWADGPRTESPPGHWNQIAQDVARREGHGIDEDAKLFFALNAALLDAGIATWEAKYAYDYVRPQSAIRDLFFDQTISAWGGPNEGTVQILGQEWQPYQNVTFVTPPFPEFVSGHSTFSMAAARTIASFVGSDAFYDGVTLSNYDLDGVSGEDFLGQYVIDELAFEDYGAGPPTVLQWETLTEAAEEAGISRIYGGIHIQDGNLRGLEVGRQVAETAETRWQALFSRAGDDEIAATKGGGLIIAGTGDDAVTGKGGDDEVEAGAGADAVSGRGGNDRILGQGGADELIGGRGRDTIEGGAGGDDVRGRQWSDSLFGGAGEDSLFGGNGRDLISGGDGADFLRGGRKADRFVFEAGETKTDVVAALKSAT
ncbi:MAG: DUF6851 domain-containing protein, partial [Pseudomonadota bacterium]